MSDRVDVLISLAVLCRDLESREDFAGAHAVRSGIEKLIEDAGAAAMVATRRTKDRRRKAGHSAESSESVESRESVDSAESSESVEPSSPSPQVSSSFPGPHITPSSPPSPPPASSSSPPSPENALLARLGLAGQAVVTRFLSHTDAEHQRLAWVGRLTALMDETPHFTPEEMAEGLEALMTEPRESWKPVVLKAWVRRVRNDATRVAAAEQAAEPELELRAEEAWDYITGELVKKHTTKQISAADYELLGPRSSAALKSVGGLHTIHLTELKQRQYLKRDFLRTFIAYRAPSE